MMNKSVFFHNGRAVIPIFLLFAIIGAYANALNGSWMKSISEELSADLDVIKHDELGFDYVNQLYSTFKYRSATFDANRTVHEIAHKLESKIQNIFNALSKVKGAIENIQTLSNGTNAHSNLVPCRQANKTLDIFETIQSKRWVSKNGVKQQYYISSSDVRSYPFSPFSECHFADHMLLWNNYISRNLYAQKNIILVLDHGGSLSKYHFYIAKLLAKQLIATLNNNDNIVLLAISNDWASPQLDEECLMPNKVPATTKEVPNFSSVNSIRKKLLEKFVDNLPKGSGATNHSLGLQQALKVLQRNQVQNETVILYVSRGLLSSLTEAKAVLETILQYSENITTPFVINTCAVIDESRPTIYETQFMEDVALQNYKKYNISSTKTARVGTMLTVNSSEAVGFAISHLYSLFNTNSSFESSRKISLPKWDSKSGDVTSSFSIGFTINHHFGLLGIDSFFTNWADEVLYFSNNKNLDDVFLIDLEGRTIVHPLFGSLTNMKQQYHFVDISHFENVPNFPMIKRRILEEPSGVQSATQFGSMIKYTWRRVGEWYVVCVVCRELYRLPEIPYGVTWPNSSDSHTIKLVYQNLDNSDDSRLCRHLKQVATLDAGSLYLSPSCFQAASLFDPTTQTLDYMSYLQDHSQQALNPGLKEEVKDEVSALAHILNFLRSQHLSSFKSKYIVRRYATSYSGVLEMFPGTILNPGLDPTKRSWFIQASEHNSKLVLVPPYLDEGGAGYIVTVAYATPHVVVAVDITYGYVFRMLLKRMPFCSSSNITCFLMDDRGYLIYHPNLIDPNGHGPVEKQHIVHKESLVANDILNYPLFIRKVLCNNYGDNTIQRYYKLNTSYSDVLNNLVQGEPCVSYNIVSIRGTNLFVGMVNASCNVVVTFCPCSIVDRLCLNCHRMEQKECECPCECPIEQSKCTDLNLHNPLCTWYPDLSLKAQFHEDATSELQSCFPASCSVEKSHYRCLGVTGCEWCKFDVDGTLLANPFCASLATCFNGVVGSVTPYKNAIFENGASPESFNVPMTFVVLVIVAVLVGMLFFYLYHRPSGAAPDRLYLSSTQENQLRMSDLNLSDYHTVANHRDKLLQDDKPDPLSPYYVTSGYRRAAFGADSDHGYSTMTQQDESEQMSLAPLELEDELADHVGPQTQLPCAPRNRMVVPVMVHRMDMT